MPTSHLWQEAASFAARAHEYQYRKDGITPYVSHPVRVALTVACVFGFADEKMLAAALLHDVIEDTSADYDDLHEQFGNEVAEIVATLTKDMRLIEAKREVEYDAQLAAGPWQARLIKLADVYDNLLNASDAKAQRKQINHAERALKLAVNDVQLERACKLLAALVQSTSLNR